MFEFHKEKQMWFQGLTLMEFRLEEELEASPFSEAAPLRFVHQTKGLRLGGLGKMGPSHSFFLLKKMLVNV